MDFGVYTDGSFGNDGMAHGGIVFIGNDGKPAILAHVTTTNTNFVSMRNVGGEVLAAYIAIKVCVERIRLAGVNEKHTITIIHDYVGISKWIMHEWRANKPATKWYVKEISEMLASDKNIHITFGWVHGHTGFIYNELADKVASYDMNYVKANNIPIYDMDDTIKGVE